jgi:hypothetical protein
MNRSYTDIEIQFIRDNISGMSFKEIASALNRSTSAVKNAAYKRDLKRDNKHVWTAEEDQYLRDFYPNVDSIQLANDLNLNRYAVLNRAYILGIKKSNEFIKAMGYKVSKDPASIALRYKKGNVPYNTGKRMHEYLSSETIENIKAHSFKKGNIPANTKYDGYERINVDGYIEVRVSKGKFVQKHRLIWEERHGKIPAGTNIQFRDGIRQHCVYENLYAITREEQMIDNSINNYPPEARQSLRLIGKISKLINNQENEKAN